jgi:hypothetical protein
MPSKAERSKGRRRINDGDQSRPQVPYAYYNILSYVNQVQGTTSDIEYCVNSIASNWYFCLLTTLAERFDRIFEEVNNENLKVSVSKMLAKDAGVEREPPGSRTLNLLIKSQLLYQLS